MLTESPEEVKARRAANSQKGKDWVAVRAEALSTAVFYGECALGGLEIENCTASAAEIARLKQKWWLPGDNPEHPSLNSLRSTPQHGLNTLSSTLKEAAVPKSPSLHRATEEVPVAGRASLPDSRRPVVVNDLNVPLFAQDDDLGSMPSMDLLCKSKTDKVHQPVCVSTSTNCKSAQGIPQQLFGSSETLIRSHTVYSRVHGPRRHQGNKKRTHASISGSNSTRKYGLQDEIDRESLKIEILKTKNIVLSSLDTNDTIFFDAVMRLEQLYQSKTALSSMLPPKKLTTSNPSTQEDHVCIDGQWEMISPPAYPACLGVNENGDKLFTLSRMAFDMFQPASLVCSIQSQYNTIRTVRCDEKLPAYIPPSLRKEAEREHKKHYGRLKTHNIIASFTIEKGADKKLKGVLMNYGFTLPDPSSPNRYSIWFTAGTIEPASEEYLEDWKELFHENKSEDKEKANSLASEILLGAVSEPMDANGTLGYYLTRPIGGHGYAYCDVVYMDADMRVMKGHSGSFLVFRRVSF